MIWSKIKRNVENKFSDNLKGKIQIYITSYGKGYDVSDLFNRGWISVDGKEVVNFATPDAFYLNGRDYHYATPTNCATSKEIYYDNRNPNLLSEKREFSKYDLSNCCYAYQELSIDEALNHGSPIINMLAMIDNRLGKRRLLELSRKDLHPLVKYFLNVRLNAENSKGRGG